MKQHSLSGEKFETGISVCLQKEIYDCEGQGCVCEEEEDQKRKRINVELDKDKEKELSPFN